MRCNLKKAFFLSFFCAFSSYGMERQDEVNDIACEPLLIESVSSNMYGPFPQEIWMLIFQYLNPFDQQRLLSCSNSFYTLSTQVDSPAKKQLEIFIHDLRLAVNRFNDRQQFSDAAAEFTNKLYNLIYKISAIYAGDKNNNSKKIFDNKETKNAIQKAIKTIDITQYSPTFLAINQKDKIEYLKTLYQDEEAPESTWSSCTKVLSSWLRDRPFVGLTQIPLLTVPLLGVGLLYVYFDRDTIFQNFMNTTEPFPDFPTTYCSDMQMNIHLSYFQRPDGSTYFSELEEKYTIIHPGNLSDFVAFLTNKTTTEATFWWDFINNSRTSYCASNQTERTVNCVVKTSGYEDLLKMIFHKDFADCAVETAYIECLKKYLAISLSPWTIFNFMVLCTWFCILEVK